MHRIIVDFRPLFGIPLTIYSYGLMMALAFLAAYFLAQRRAAREGLDRETMGNLWFICLVAGIIGARAYFVIQHREIFREDPAASIAIWHGGLVWHGGVILATIAGILYLRHKKVSVLAAGDVAATAAMLGLAIGRLGCLLNGCCFGKICQLDWLPWPLKLTFPPGSPPYEAHFAGDASSYLRSPPVYATQVFSMIGAFVIFLVLDRFFKYKKNNGEIFALMGMLYSIDRFIIEFFRDEPAFALGLTDDQILNIIIFIIAIIAFLYLRTKKKQPRTAAS